MQTVIIDTFDKLKAICKQFRQGDYLIIDTEFERRNTYYPVLALLQVCDGKTIALIDPLAVSDLDPLIQLCFEPDIEKVLHAARQDLEIIFHLCGKLPYPVFDTQIAAALLGSGAQIGYAALVKQYLNIDLDKSQTRTNWMQRPLTSKQLEYAANDVLYLDQVYKIQKQQLIEMNRLHWLQNDFDFLTSPSTYQPDLPNLWKRIRGHQKLNQHQLVVLQFLAKWREQEAMRRNLVRNKILHDESMLEIARRKPQSLASLQSFHCLSEYFIRHYGKTIIKLIKQALQSDPEKWPHLPQYKPLTPLQDALTDCLMAINHLCASENKISPNCLTTRKELEKLVSGKRQNLHILNGWRYELAGKQLLEFLNGKHKLMVQSEQLLLI